MFSLLWVTLSVLLFILFVVRGSLSVCSFCLVCLFSTLGPCFAMPLLLFLLVPEYIPDSLQVAVPEEAVG